MFQNIPDDLESLLSIYTSRFICPKKMWEEARRKLKEIYLHSDDEIKKGQIYNALRRRDRAELLILGHPIKSALIGLISSATLAGIAYCLYQLYKN